MKTADPGPPSDPRDAAEGRDEGGRKAGDAAKRSAARPRKSRAESARASARKALAGAFRRPLVWGLAAMAVTIGLACGVLVFGYGRLRGPEKPSAVELDWPAGIGSDEAAALLAGAGLIDGEPAMAMFLRATGGTSDFVPGPHLLPSGASPWELRRMLSRSADRPQARVTIPEGWNRFDIAARLEKLQVAGRRAFLEASADAALLDKLGIERGGAVGAESAEGYLFPATYELPKDADAREVVERLVKESDRRWAAILEPRKDGFAALQASLGWGRREVLTLASMIEKEAAVDEERPLIASVFLNRLLDPSFRPKRLQSDPTSSYGCIAWPSDAPSCADFAGKPTPAINQDPKNRYSTYVRAGLPPGPIANPGSKSVEAVLAPAATRYLYFVASGGGRHTFSESLDAHNDAVKKQR